VLSLRQIVGAGRGAKHYGTYALGLAGCAALTGIGAAATLQFALDRSSTPTIAGGLQPRDLRVPSRVEMAKRIEVRQQFLVVRAAKAPVIVNQAPAVPISMMVASLERAEAVVLEPAEIKTAVVERTVVKLAARLPAGKLKKRSEKLAVCKTKSCKRTVVASAKSKSVRSGSKVNLPVFAQAPIKLRRLRFAETTADIIQRNLNFRG
jgi:hypothetical protein